MSTPFVVRPRLIRWIAGAVAFVLLAVFGVVAVLLKDSKTGVYFHTSDQVAMAGIGVLLALGVLWLAWPRVRADAEGVEVRNLLGTRRFSWDVVRHLSFPDGARWARLELPADEYVPMMAIQAIDRDRAVAAMRELRRLHREASPGQKVPAQPGPDEHREDPRGPAADEVRERRG